MDSAEKVEPLTGNLVLHPIKITTLIVRAGLIVGFQQD